MSTKKILVYGDSFLAGQRPDDLYQLYPEEHTIPGLLQMLLEDNYTVINEGLCGRTTDITGNLKADVGRNGFTHFAPTLEKHLPVQILVLYLGTNDLKERFNRSAKEVATAIEKFIKEAKRICTERNIPLPHIILISPTIVQEEYVHPPYKMKGAEEKSRQLGKLYEEVSKRHNTAFIDLASHIQPSVHDGIHLDLEANQIVAELLYRMIKES